MKIGPYKYLSPFILFVAAWYAFNSTGWSTFIPVIYAFAFIPLIELFIRPDISNLNAAEEELAKVAADTMVGGATLTGLLGTSAWYAPGASVSYLVDAILNDQKKMIPCSVYLEGEYGQSDICIGVPCIIGKNGVEKIVDINLNDAEKALFAKSADAVRNMNNDLKSHL